MPASDVYAVCCARGTKSNNVPHKLIRSWLPWLCQQQGPSGKGQDLSLRVVFLRTYAFLTHLIRLPSWQYGGELAAGCYSKVQIYGVEHFPTMFHGLCAPEKHHPSMGLLRPDLCSFLRPITTVARYMYGSKWLIYGQN